MTKEYGERPRQFGAFRSTLERDEKNQDKRGNEIL